MAHPAHSESEDARTPTWLRSLQHRAHNTTDEITTKPTITTKPKPKPNIDLGRLKKYGRGPLFIRSPAPSPSPSGPGTLKSESPGPPPAAAAAAAVFVDSDRRREVLVCYRTCGFDFEFRLVQRRSGLVAMRRSRKARHRREREYWADMFGPVEGEGVKVKEEGEGHRSGGSEGGAGGERLVCWELVEDVYSGCEETEVKGSFSFHQY